MSDFTGRTALLNEFYQQYLADQDSAALVKKIDAHYMPGTLEELAPELAEAWNQRAIAYFNMGRFTDSIRDCRQALELNPHHFGAAIGMGQCYLQLNDRTAALESFRRALKLNPNLEGVRAHVVY